MNLEARKISFIQEFLSIQSEEIVRGLEDLLREKKAKLIEESFKPMSMQQFNDEIEQALDDSKKGRIIKATDLKTKIKKWS